ncbi:hypothetical protein OL548_23810 [Lysinibacillus sp. MHQ-1]|nr:hypothetical protein OL548_23810 [Lysinibacillus sp. MHQ-1]
MPIHIDIVNRKGARKVSEIPEDVLTLLNEGEIESVNLTEWLGGQSYFFSETCPT